MAVQYKDMLEAELKKCLDDQKLPQKIIFDAAKYSLLNGGKRLRGVFLLAFCDGVGGDIDAAMPFACAIEMIHAYSLVHDDLPCMDNDDLRRGVPTNHRVYGEAVALLAGDALLNGAYELMFRAATCGAPNAAKAGRIMAESAGAYGMIGGQILDISQENEIKDAEYLKNMVALKTGKLFYAACVCGAIIGGGSAEQIEAAGDYARNIGLAFQIQDDVLDIVGDTAELGKNTKSDEQNGKCTFVSCYGLEKCKKEVEVLTKNAITAIKDMKNSEMLTQVASELVERKS